MTRKRKKFADKITIKKQISVDKSFKRYSWQERRMKKKTKHQTINVIKKKGRPTSTIHSRKSYKILCFACMLNVQNPYKTTEGPRGFNP